MKTIPFDGGHAPGNGRMRGPRYDCSARVSNLLSFAQTDVGNAERLCALYRDEILYCHEWGRWLRFVGLRWCAVPESEIRHLATITIRKNLAQALKLKDDKARQLAVAYSRRSESLPKIRAMVLCAQAEKGITVAASAFDSDPWILNCANGTIELRSGKLRPHDAADLITKLAPVVYDPHARLSAWDNFLDVVAGGDKELSEFLQRAAGSSLVGEPSDEIVFFFFGDGATGKSTCLAAFKGALGDYAVTLDFGSLLRRSNSGGPRNDLARLAGARLVISNEVDEGSQLAVGLVKSLSGGDSISVRFLFKEAFEVVPSFTFMLAANHCPSVSGADNAIWRRIVLVPFSQVVPPEKRDPKLKALLRDPERAGPAVLAWLVEGCLDWQVIGLAVPDSVVRATDNYRQEMDDIGRFLNECCVEDPEATVAKLSLYDAYVSWFRQEGMRRESLSKLLFGKELSNRGFQETRTGDARFWQGVRLNGFAVSITEFVDDKNDENDENCH